MAQPDRPARPPARFVACTLNLWGDERWPARRASLAEFLRRHWPDVLGVQELRAGTRAAIDEALGDHDRVDDPGAGWRDESNVYWRRSLFERADHGVEEIGRPGNARRLFWVRLRLRHDGFPPLLVATAHYTWPGHAHELATATSPRPDEALRTAEVLDRLAPQTYPVLFMGDLNDFFRPLQVLHEAGLVDAYSALGRNPSPTIPATPARRCPPSVADWMLHRGPVHPMSTDAVDFFHDEIAPSDHKPLLTTYRLERD